MPEPLDETLPIADMRTRDSKVIERPSGNLLDTINRYQQFQDWYHDYVASRGPVLGFREHAGSAHGCSMCARILRLDRAKATSLTTAT